MKTALEWMRKYIPFCFSVNACLCACACVCVQNKQKQTKKKCQSKQTTNAMAMRHWHWHAHKKCSVLFCLFVCLLVLCIVLCVFLCFFFFFSASFLFFFVLLHPFRCLSLCPRSRTIALAASWHIASVRTASVHRSAPKPSLECTDGQRFVSAFLKSLSHIPLQWVSVC